MNILTVGGEIKYTNLKIQLATFFKCHLVSKGFLFSNVFIIVLVHGQWRITKISTGF